MEFFIGQNATLPLLKLQVVKDGNNDYDDMMQFIERSTIFFSMVNIETGIPKIMTKSAGFVEKLDMNPNASPEYYVYYRLVLCFVFFLVGLCFLMCLFFFFF